MGKLGHLHIVVWKWKEHVKIPGVELDYGWRTFFKGQFTDSESAEKFIESEMTILSPERFDFGIVAGPIVTPEEIAQAEADLLSF